LNEFNKPLFSVFCEFLHLSSGLGSAAGSHANTTSSLYTYILHLVFLLLAGSPLFPLSVSATSKNKTINESAQRDKNIALAVVRQSQKFWPRCRHLVVKPVKPGRAG